MAGYQNQNGLKVLEQKLEHILNSAEAQHPFNRQNFVSMKKLVFLWIIGNNGQELEGLLQAERQKIVEEDQTICIIRSDAGKIDAHDIYQQFLRGIENASQAYMSVDMYHIVVCPIFLPGCFSSEDESKNYQEVTIHLQKEMAKRQRYLQWTPFFLMENEKVEISRMNLNCVINFMESIMAFGRANHMDCCCPCCVISDANERGQVISIEQAAKIILMVTAFRNTNCENEQPLTNVLYPITAGSEAYFYTARAISICEPIKSLVLNRLLAVQAQFLQGLFDQAKIYENWQHQFFRSDVWRKQLDKLPHDERYQILLAPIYSNVPMQDQNLYIDRLKQFGKKYYFDPLMENEKEILEEWWKSFWREYFLTVCGSFDNLDSMEANQERILERVPALGVLPAGNVYVTDLRRDCEKSIGTELIRYQRVLVEKAFRADGHYMDRFRRRKKELDEIMKSMVTVLKNRERKLRQTELLLNTGGGHVANPLEEAQDWMREHMSNEPKKIKEIYWLFQDCLRQLFLSEDASVEMVQNMMLDIYYKVVSGTIESRVDYMENKLANLAGSDMAQLINRLGESWLYPARLIGTGDDRSLQKMYVMGSRNNFLCRKILEQPNYQVAFKENMLDDRLEIVRISELFLKKQIFTEE